MKIDKTQIQQTQAKTSQKNTQSIEQAEQQSFFSS